MSVQKTYFEKVIHENFPHQPNLLQQTAISQLCEFILHPHEREVFLLKGYAGTGKTNLISAVIKALPSIKWKSVLMAPTGRAAKVLSNYSLKPAQTIHKKIFRKSLSNEGSVFFSLAENLHKHTLFIVDEASMIGADSGENLFNSLLENLFEYVFSGENCKLILIGDTAQLPPVHSNESPALDENYLRSAFHLNLQSIELNEVARQKHESYILKNATTLRQSLNEKETNFPKLICGEDFVKVNGEELEDVLSSALSNYGDDNVIIITRSNKRANLFNQSFRNRIKLYDEFLNSGDHLMVVKNNYFWLEGDNAQAGFIANGDSFRILKIRRHEQLYGFNFSDCTIQLIDYPLIKPFDVKLITNSLFSDDASLSQADQKKLMDMVLEDVLDEPIKSTRLNYLRKSLYYNALQVKFAYAVTCHKSQGGQWPIVFIDQGYLKDEHLDNSYKRWLYTAITRASEKVYLVNFNERFF